MDPKSPKKRISRREFLLLALAGTGGAAWFITHPNLEFLAPKQTPAALKNTSSSAATESATKGSPAGATSSASASIPPSETAVVIPTQTLPKNQARAVETYQAVVKNFSIPGSPLFIEGINPKDDKDAAFLWPYTSLLAAIQSLGRMKNIGHLYLPEIERVLTGMQAYFDAANNPPGYQSYILAKGGGDRYYDDNEWVILLFADAYTLFKKEEYLQKAIVAFDYSVSGWSDEMGGGIYWREFKSTFDHRTKNTCSNAPAAVGGLQLYQLTKKEEYLQWAQRIVQWMARLKSPENGIYFDNVDSDGIIDKRHFTYNTGTMIHANALLYSVSNDKKYLEEARSLAEAAYKYFARDYNGSGVLLYLNDPWFNTVLLRGFAALYEVDPAKNRKYLDHFLTNLDYAWENARSTTGLFSRNWLTPSLPNTKKVIIDQAAMIENYAIMSLYE